MTTVSQTQTRSLVGSATLVVLGSLLMAASAKVQLPFWPVPMTMASLTVLLIGVAYGSRLGAATLLAYMAEGAAGLPVFAGTWAGPAYIAGPTGGYLVGYVASAALVGWLAERGWDRDGWRVAGALSAGHVLMFVPGVAWLCVFFGFSKAIAAGVTPFVVATVVKTGLGVAIVCAMRGVFAAVRR
jgi:biotin transport system substrate-specific component